MADVLKGNVVANKIKEKMAEDIESLKGESKIPKLAIIRLGENPGDISYEKSIIKNCDKIGIESEVFERDKNITTEKLVDLIEGLNLNNIISFLLGSIERAFFMLEISLSDVYLTAYSSFA
mgnify:CR=1 FL=1